MSDRGGSESRRSSAFLWTIALVLVAAATAVLVLSDDARLLRLGLVAALWAALFGAFGVARLRHRIAEGDRRATEQQRIYELELEREIAARHEFEAEAEAEARRRVAEETDDEMRQLRAELGRLRSILEQVTGGDVLFERVALRAGATRVRRFPEDPQPLPAAQPGEIAGRLTGEHPVPPAEPVREEHHQRPRRPEPQPAPRPGRPAAPSTDTPVSVTVEGDLGAGAHAEGTSVNDLIAAYGGPGDTQRRRRRRA